MVLVTGSVNKGAAAVAVVVAQGAVVWLNENDTSLYSPCAYERGRYQRRTARRRENIFTQAGHREDGNRHNMEPNYEDLRKPSQGMILLQILQYLATYNT